MYIFILTTNKNRRRHHHRLTQRQFQKILNFENEKHTTTAATAATRRTRTTTTAFQWHVTVSIKRIAAVASSRAGRSGQTVAAVLHTRRARLLSHLHTTTSCDVHHIQDRLVTHLAARVATRTALATFASQFVAATGLAWQTSAFHVTWTSAVATTRATD